MMNRPPFLPRSSSFQFLLFKLLTLIQLFDHSSGCTPAGSGCCSSPRPASCGNLPPCSPGSMSASHLSSYSHVAPPPPLHEKGGYGHGHDGGEYGYHSDGVGYEHGGYEQERGYGEGGYGSGSGYGPKPPPYQPPPGSYGQISYGQLPPTGSYGGMGYSQPGGYSSNYPSYQPPPPMPAAPLMPPNYYPSSPPPSAIPSPQYLPPPPPPPYGSQPYPQSISLPVQQPVYSIGNSPLPPYSAQYPELASSYHSSSLSSYNPQQQQYPQLTPSQYSPAISSPSFAEPIYSNGYSNGGAMPPGIMPPSYQNPQSNGGGMISYPPNGPFLMTLAGGPPGGYKTNKKQKILLVEKLMAKDKAASAKEKVAAAVKEKMTKE